MISSGQSRGILISLESKTKAVEKQLSKVGIAIRPRTILKLIGARLENWINMNFQKAGAEKKWAPLSQNTLANPKRRGSPPLRVTGRLAMSFKSNVISDKEVVVGTPMELAKYHHFGTRPYTIRPKEKQALAFFTVSGRTIRRFVRHPGLPRRPLLPSQGLANRLVQETLDAYAKREIELANKGK